jgi:hypothetical protein
MKRFIFHRNLGLIHFRNREFILHIVTFHSAIWISFQTGFCCQTKKNNFGIFWKTSVKNFDILHIMSFCGYLLNLWHCGHLSYLPHFGMLYLKHLATLESVQVCIELTKKTKSNTSFFNTKRIHFLFFSVGDWKSAALQNFAGQCSGPIYFEAWSATYIQTFFSGCKLFR